MEGGCTEELTERSEDEGSIRGDDTRAGRQDSNFQDIERRGIETEEEGNDTKGGSEVGGIRGMNRG